MKTLKSMVQFVLDEGKKPNNSDYRQRFVVNVLNHALLLSQPPNIGMFVPAVCEDGKWRVLEEPKYYELWRKYGSFTQYREHLTSVCEPYCQAQSKVIFKGWEKTDCKGFDLVRNHVLLRLSDYNTLEDLVKFNLEIL
jgi:hypothetical protein